MGPSIDILLEDERWSAQLDLEAFAAEAVSACVKTAGVTLRPGAEVSLLFTNDARVRELNSAWRGKDAATNVLSFPAYQPGRLETAQLLGDVALAYETVRNEADREEKLFSAHSQHLIVHGILHLLGYDHETDSDAHEMEALESRILVGLGAPDPWRDEPDSTEAS